MRYLTLIAIVASLQIPTSQADAPMSPEVKAYLCELAKRDAAITEADIEKQDQERAACLASNSTDESSPSTRTTCTAQGAKHVFAGIHRQARIVCDSTITESHQGKECPEPTRKLRQRMEGAPERVAEYCTDN